MKRFSLRSLTLALAIASVSTPLIAATVKIPVSFEANQGQTDVRVKFLTRGQGYALFLTGTEAVLSLDGKQGHSRDVLRMKLAGASPSVPQGVGELNARSHYFIGKDPKKWSAGIPHYARVQYHEVTPGVDLVYHGGQDRLEYDVIVRPGADPKNVTLAFEGARRMEVNAQGDLVLRLAYGDLVQHRPVIYQEGWEGRKIVDGGYVLKGKNRVGFRVAAYDRGKPLVIDPTLSYSTYLGGTGNDTTDPHNVATDSTGAIYLIGLTTSTDFPTKDPFQGTPGGGSASDLFIAKLDPSQSGSAQLVYATYLGGDKEESVSSLALGPDGGLYVIGLTKSTDYPTKNAFQGALSGIVGFNDVVFTKLDPSQTGTDQLVYSTYFGGDEADFGAGVVVDASGIAYLTGRAGSSNFPVRNAFQTTFSNDDAFVAKIDPSLSGDASLLYSTLLGGSDSDNANDLDIDSTGKVYVTGITSSNDFPIKNEFESFPTGDIQSNAFFSVLDPSQSGSAQLLYSTYFGGAANGESGLAVAADSERRVTVAGYTRSTDLPTRNGFQTDLNTADKNDTFVAQFDPVQSGDASLLYATYLGGNGDSEEASDVATDHLGRIYVTGLTSATDFPTRNALFDTIGGLEDAFLAKLDPSQSGDASLLFATYFGGAGDDNGSGVAVDEDCNVTFGGFSGSANLTTQNPFQSALSGTNDAFVARILFENPSITSSLTAGGTVGETFSYTITADGEGTLAFAAQGLPAGLTLSGSEISGTPTAAGTSNVVLTAIDDNCDDRKTLVISIAAAGSGTGGGGDGGGCSLLANAAPWELDYHDGSGNFFKAWQGAGDAKARFDYTPVIPAESSSGTYSGGEPKLGFLSPKEVSELWKRAERLAADKSLHAEARAMGTGAFRLKKPDGSSDFLIANSPSLKDFDALLSKLRATAPSAEVKDGIFAVYPDAAKDASQSGATSLATGKNFTTVTYATEAPLDSVLGFYKPRLQTFRRIDNANGSVVFKSETGKLILFKSGQGTKIQMVQGPQ